MVNSASILQGPDGGLKKNQTSPETSRTTFQYVRCRVPKRLLVQAISAFYRTVPSLDKWPNWNVRVKIQRHPLAEENVTS